MIPGINFGPGMAAGLDLNPYAGFLSATHATTNSSSKTWAGLNLGTPHPNRVIMGFSTHHVGSAGRVLNNGTIGGVAITIPRKSYDSTGEDHFAMFYAHVPEGEVGDLYLNIGYSAAYWGYMLFELRNLGLAPASTSMTKLSSSTVNFTRNTEDGGALIGGMCNNSTAAGTTYAAPATEVADWSTGYTRMSSGLITPTDLATPQTMTITPPNTSQIRQVGLAAWAPT